MKKLISALLILLLFGGTVFVIGWTQLYVPAGQYGVLVSKTGGIDPSTIKPASFRWSWERLIPTNARILAFDLAPLKTSVSSTGTLPSGELYSGMLEGNPDFSWDIQAEVTARVKGELLPELVERLNIRDQASLDQWAKDRVATLADSAGKSAIGDVVASSLSSSAPAAVDGAPDSIGDAVARRMGFVSPELDVISVSVTGTRVPDVAMYRLAADAYASYQKRRGDLLAKAAIEESENSVAEYLQIERFSKWGELLTKYPILIEYLAVTSNDREGAFKALKTIR